MLSLLGRLPGITTDRNRCLGTAKGGEGSSSIGFGFQDGIDVSSNINDATINFQGFQGDRRNSGKVRMIAVRRYY